MGRKKAKKPRRIIHHRKGWKLYPSFTYPQRKSEIAYVPEHFIELVKEAVRTLDFTDDSLFDDRERAFYQLVKTIGFGDAFDEVFGDPGEHTAEFLHFIARIGQYIYDYIDGAGKFRTYLPYCDAQVIIDKAGKNFAVYFDALLSRSTPDGRMYYSKNMPKVIIDKQEIKISFSRHAIERICERTCGKMNYCGMGDAFNYFTNLVSFESCYLPNNQPAVSFFDYCAPKFFSGSYVKQVLGEKVVEEKHKYRVGYCPVDFFDGYAKAITLLTPGMRGTPEYKVLKQAKLNRQEKLDIEESANNSAKLCDLAETQDFRAIKWFHDNGIPQVVEFEKSRK